MKRLAIILLIILSVATATVLCSCDLFSKTEPKEETYTAVFIIPARYVSSPSEFEYSRQQGLKSQEELVIPGNPQNRSEVGSNYVESAGYRFLGWSYDLETVFDPSTKLEMQSYMKFYGLYEIIEYHVTYDLKGGTIEDPNPATYTVEDGGKNDRGLWENKIYLKEPSRPGYRFVTWHWKEDAVTVPDPPLNYISTAENDLGDKEYFAEWEPDTYYINYRWISCEPAELNTLPFSFTVEDGEVPLVTDLTPDVRVTRWEGYEFIGYYDNENFTGDPITAIPVNTFHSVTLYAKWVKNT